MPDKRGGIGCNLRGVAVWMGHMKALQVQGKFQQAGMKGKQGLGGSWEDNWVGNQQVADMRLARLAQLVRLVPHNHPQGLQR